MWGGKGWSMSVVACAERIRWGWVPFYGLGTRGVDRRHWK